MHIASVSSIDQFVILNTAINESVPSLKVAIKKKKKGKSKDTICILNL